MNNLEKENNTMISLNEKKKLNKQKTAEKKIKLKGKRGKNIKEYLKREINRKY